MLKIEEKCLLDHRNFAIRWRRVKKCGKSGIQQAEWKTKLCTVFYYPIGLAYLEEHTRKLSGWTTCYFPAIGGTPVGIKVQTVEHFEFFLCRNLCSCSNYTNNSSTIFPVIYNFMIDIIVHKYYDRKQTQILLLGKLFGIWVYHFRTKWCDGMN